MDRLATLHYITARYHRLQGLRLLPLAIPFLGSLAWRLGWLTWLPGSQGVGAGRWFAATFVAVLGVSWGTGRYYRRRFGVLLPAHRPSTVLWTLGFILALTASLGLPLDYSKTISVPMLVIATGLARLGISDGHIRRAYLTVAVACFIFATLAPLGVPFSARSVLLDCLTIFGILAIGVSDHRMLNSARFWQNGRTV